mgnify:CR=1 FL=1
MLAEWLRKTGDDGTQGRRRVPRDVARRTMLD